MKDIDFIDDFSSCRRTYATLSLYNLTMPAAQVSLALGIQPTRESEAALNKPNAWFFSTQGFVNSRDLRRHLFFIFDKLENKISALSLLREAGWKVILHCFWESESGNGGPIIDVATSKRLSLYLLDVHFDIWIGDSS